MGRLSLADASHGGPIAPQAPAGEAQSSQFQMGQKVNGKAVAKTMRDGTGLCPAFQQGNCKVKGSSCPKGAHRYCCGDERAEDMQLGEPWGTWLHGEDKGLKLP